MVDRTPADWSEVLCRIEGCARAFANYGDDEPCGLTKVYQHENCPSPPECGAVATIAKWEAMGLVL